jgi:hypothetical protein
MQKVLAKVLANVVEKMQWKDVLIPEDVLKTK